MTELESRRRLLVLMPRYPYPPSGGDRLRILRICEYLSRHYSLTLVCLCRKRDEMEHMPDDGVFSEIHKVRLPTWQSLLNAGMAFFSRTPLQIAYYRSLRFSAAVARLLPSHDAALCHLVRTCEPLLTASIPRALEMTDAISLTYERIAGLPSTGALLRLLYRMEARRLRKFEREVLPKFDLATLVSPVDRDLLIDTNSLLHVKVIPNGANLFEGKTDARRNGREIVFIGTMQYAPNLDAAVYFSKEVLPLLREHGDFTFTVIGTIAPRARRQLERLVGVNVEGFVPDLLARTGGSFAAVAPMRSGAGIQNKILDYFALGIPAVTSSIGLEGLNAAPDREILVADSSHQFADQILKIYRDPEFADELATAAKGYLRKHHDWEKLLAVYARELDQIMSAVPASHSQEPLLDTKAQ